MYNICCSVQEQTGHLANSGVGFPNLGVDESLHLFRRIREISIEFSSFRFSTISTANATSTASSQWCYSIFVFLLLLIVKVFAATVASRSSTSTIERVETVKGIPITLRSTSSRGCWSRRRGGGSDRRRW